MPEIHQSPKPIPLEYDRVGPPRWGKRIRRILLGLILVVTCFCAWAWGPYVWHQSRLLYWQRQCLSFSTSPDTVVYEEEPTAASLLLQRSAYTRYVLNQDKYNPTAVQAAAFSPRCWDTLGTLTTFPWSPLYRDGRKSLGAIIFLHERVSPAGHRRLVCVRYAPIPAMFTPGFVEGFNYDIYVASLAAWTRPLTFAQQKDYIADLMGYCFKQPPLLRV